MLRIDETLQRIREAPGAYPLIYRQLRRAVLRQFPFAIFYEVTADEILVFAIYYSRRDPDKLRKRVEKP